MGNPIEIDVDVEKISKEMGLDPSIETLTFPQMISEAIANKQPSKENKRELLERLKMTNSAMLGENDESQQDSRIESKDSIMSEKENVNKVTNMKVLEDVSR